ncbi:paraquat-inducible protein A [Alteromonas sp. 5E99-2]|uniref:paraquat-inducible protein A n=1 Tax=Alteromonas sp. 5E99-2 TaxID=2817683 RepID=UPI001A99FC74|nr:paraquat-inducible protein A [Alteromonas sp. 5E99-2]MBO1256179.1 paraquat-inducible protein A [Alteromonas sp. 5E99-2]
MDKQPAFTTHCHLCGLKVAIPELDKSHCAQCPRCTNTLSQYLNDNKEKALSFALAALVFLALSLPYKFLSFSASGQQREIDLPSGLQTLAELDFYPLALVTALLTLFIPAIVLLGIISLNGCRVINKKPTWLIPTFKMVKLLLPWSMAEIFLVGTLVSLVKIADMATLDVGMSFIAFCLFIVCMTATLYFYDSTEFSDWLDEASLPPNPITHLSRQKSIQQTWALLFTATLLYIPANTLPIMHTQFFGSIEPSTIIGGVIKLWHTGSYPIAIIIFLASVAIPIAKLIVLAWLNWSIQTQSEELHCRRALAYQLVEWVGRWSMIDVFVVAVLVALIQLGGTISIFPGYAALAFCAVVFFTMLAAITFDSRLIWQKETLS